MSTLEIRNLYDKEHYEDLKNRAQRITKDQQPLWGKMNAAQMFAHCAEVQEVMNGKSIDMPWYMKLFSGFVKKMVTNTKPYKKELPTAPQYVTTGEEHDFDAEKARFLEAITIFYERKDEKPHPYFGSMTDTERGWAMYKHHDHHLQQFDK